MKEGVHVEIQVLVKVHAFEIMREFALCWPQRATTILDNNTFHRETITCSKRCMKALPVSTFKQKYKFKGVRQL